MIPVGIWTQGDPADQERKRVAQEHQNALFVMPLALSELSRKCHFLMSPEEVQLVQHCLHFAIFHRQRPDDPVKLRIPPDELLKRYGSDPSKYLADTLPKIEELIKNKIYELKSLKQNLLDRASALLRFAPTLSLHALADCATNLFNDAQNVIGHVAANEALTAISYLDNSAACHNAENIPNIKAVQRPKKNAIKDQINRLIVILSDPTREPRRFSLYGPQLEEKSKPGLQHLR